MTVDPHLVGKHGRQNTATRTGSGSSTPNSVCSVATIGNKTLLSRQGKATVCYYTDIILHLGTDQSDESSMKELKGRLKPHEGEN